MIQSVIQMPQYRTFPEWNAAGTFLKHKQKCNRYVLSCDSKFVLRLYNIFYIADTGDCQGNPCENGGTCTDAVNGYICKCVPGYTHDNCHIGISEY